MSSILEYARHRYFGLRKARLDKLKGASMVPAGVEVRGGSVPWPASRYQALPRPQIERRPK